MPRKRTTLDAPRIISIVNRIGWSVRLTIPLRTEKRPVRIASQMSQPTQPEKASSPTAKSAT